MVLNNTDPFCNKRGNRHTYVRPYITKTKISSKTKNIILCLFALCSIQNSPAQNTAEIHTQEFSFLLKEITFNDDAHIKETFSALSLLQQFQGKTVSLKDIQSIENIIHEYYTNELKKPDVKIVVTLPPIGSNSLHVDIQEYLKIKADDKIEKAIIENIQFSGNITLEPQNILDIANRYTQKPYSMIQALNLRKELTDLYKTNNLKSTILLPEFSATTGDLFVHIEESIIPPQSTEKEKKASHTKVNKPAETIKETQTVKSLEFHEVSKNIFLLNPAPKSWKEPRWLTNPKAKLQAKEKPTHPKTTKNIKTSSIQIIEKPKVETLKPQATFIIQPNPLPEITISPVLRVDKNNKEHLQEQN